MEMYRREDPQPWKAHNTDKSCRAWASQVRWLALVWQVLTKF